MKAFLYSLGSLVAAGLLAAPAMAGVDVAVADLPTEVTAAIEKNYPGSKLIKAEKELKKEGELYEVKIEHNKVQRELYLKPDGMVVKDELDD